MAKVIVFLFEGADKEFIKNLIIRDYGFLGQDRENKVLYSSQYDTYAFFPHPGGDNLGSKSDFDKKITYKTCRIFTENTIRTFTITYSGNIQYLLLRDADGISETDKEKIGSLYSHYNSLFCEARCDVSGVLSVLYSRHKIENWYIAGLDSSHFSQESLCKPIKKNILKVRDAEIYNQPKKTFLDCLNNSSMGAKDQAIEMGNSINKEIGMERSKSFRIYIGLLESLLGNID